MSSLAEQDGPGLLYITSEPKPGYEDEYHHWYNTEHGPLRMKLDFVKNGYRYRSIDSEPPLYLALYDLSRIGRLEEPEYTVLRDERSPREVNVIDNKLIELNRNIYKDVSCRGHDGGPAPVIMTVAFVVKREDVPEMHRWYEEEHTEDLSWIPGWRRTRRFQLIEGPDMKEDLVELLAIHDFDKQNGLDGPEHEFAKSRPWRTRILNLVQSRVNRRYELFHEFHAADYRKPPVPTNAKSDQGLDWAASWNLQGPENGPIVVFSNSLPTNQHIWDETIEKLRQQFPHFRYLTYNFRGYASDPGKEVTIDTLTDDLAHLLDMLKIDKCYAVVGVSLGGVTALNFATRHPHRLMSYAACDCNVVATDSNSKAWHERQKLARKSWEQLADQTVKRWFTAESVEAQTEGLNRVRSMILEANIEGFVRCANALCNFDLREQISSMRVPGFLIAGAKDGVLPEVMRKASTSVPGCSFTVIPDAGHMPMVEAPAAFVAAIRPLFETGIKD